MITILLQKILAALTQLLLNLKTKLNTIKDNLDNLIVVATASGPIASFTTNITKPFISFIVDIPASESGTDTVIITQTKKNLVFSKIDATVDASGVVITSSNYYKFCIAKVAQGQTYTVTTSDTQLICGFFTDIPSIGDTTYNNSRTIQESKTFTAPITGYVGFRAIYDGDYQCEVGNQATTYEPYSATTKTVSLPETVYGGEVDVTDLITPEIKAINGVNNIFTDSGDVTVDYLKLYTED